MTSPIHYRKRLILPVSTEESFDTCKGLLDWVQIGGVGWEEEKFTALFDS